ncbi:hypothetical protein BDM02DRAFT_3273532 [Thelephora ganbajun]|uniref:Uncharacterized protein n=1 Tax=Thelephora ganbajun TaxID=370292 RepID=A0ACB6YXW3_THEGA|nr:hypothetical protein BDM02DRAFT_3273532 [Thelephora ganbajun]
MPGVGLGSTDLVESRLDSVNLLQIDTIPVSTPSEDLLQRILEHENTGTPLVITGVDRDSHWYPQYSPVVEGDAPVNRRTVSPFGENDASAISAWVEALSLIPQHLLSRCEDARFPPVIKDLKCERGRQGRPFQQNHCGSVLQHLTRDLPDGSSDTWFVSAASSVQQVAIHPPTSANDLLPTFLTISELSSCPFPIYMHRQSVGDLLILPSSCYGQNLREGEGCSISWSRITLHSLELSIYCGLPMYRRFCRPERYEIRQIIQAALVSHIAAVDQLILHPMNSTSHQESPLSAVRRDLNTLVRLFDEILQEDYCSNHGLLDSVDLQRPLTCSFCGSCLFLSCFFCRGCSQPGGVPVLLCAGCYIEGRSCRCDVMNPIRLGDFSDALRDRNNAVNSLSKASDLHRVPPEGLVEVSESFFMWPKVALFEAAMELWRLKNTPEVGKKGKTCTPRGGKPSHPSPPIYLVNCKKCHAAKCFLHILQGSVHASEALLANAVDSGSTIWHKRHQEARERDTLPLARLSLVHELDPSDRRVFFARYFSTASPLEPGMRIGFYDAPFQDAPLVDIPPVLRPPAPTSLSRTSSRSTATLATDTEAPIVVGQRTQRTRGQEGASSNPGPSGQKSKRTRNSESEGSDGVGDDEYLPRKRARLSRSSTRTVHATHSMSSVAAGASDPPSLDQPAPGIITEEPSGSGVVSPSSQPTEDQGQGRVNARQTTLRRRPTRTASAASLSRPTLGMTHPSDVEPPAWKFFNPLTDMEVTAQSAELTAESSARTDTTVADRSEAVQPRTSTSASSVQSSFPQSPFVGLGSLFSRRHSNNAGPSLLRELSRAEGSNLSSSTPLAVEYLIPQGSIATGSAWSYQQPFRRHLQRQGSLPRPPSSPTNSQSSGMTVSSLVTRRDSREDIEAQRVLETIQGDSLSRENMEAYIDILRNCGALE